MGRMFMTINKAYFYPIILYFKLAVLDLVHIQDNN